MARPSRAPHGRPLGLLPAALLTALVTAASAAPVTWQPVTLPNKPHAPAVYTAASLPQSLDLGLGERTVDLRGVAVDRDRTVALSLDAGSLAVQVPATGNVVVRYTVSAGSATVAGAKTSGFDIASDWSRVVDPSAPTLTLDVTVDLGTLEVTS